MTPGSVLCDKHFSFHDGGEAKKLFVILGTLKGLYVVAKTTSKQHGRGTTYGCQPKDRFRNFYLPPNSSYLDGNTWVCLDEFYDFSAAELLKKGMDGTMWTLCTIEAHLKALQHCALDSLDISSSQAEIVRASLA